MLDEDTDETNAFAAARVDKTAMLPFAQLLLALANLLAVLFSHKLLLGVVF